MPERSTARCHEAKEQDEAAFKAYQKLIERYPKLPNYDEVILRQMTIARALVRKAPILLIEPLIRAGPGRSAR